MSAPRFLSLAATAQILAVSPDDVLDLVRSGELRALPSRRPIAIESRSVVEWVNERPSGQDLDAGGMR